MRIYDLFLIEAVVPIDSIVSQCMEIVNKSLVDYMDEIGKYRESNWSDDPDILYEVLENNTQNEIFSWGMIQPGYGHPIDWYIHSAALKDDGSILINLDYETIYENFGAKTFAKSVKKTICHETIHINQRKLMGEDFFDCITSGYRRGLKLMEKTGNKQDLFDQYFTDPTEVMAHGYDLAFEIYHHKNRKNIMENIETHIKTLPTLHRYVLRGFPLTHPSTRGVISYSKEYLRGMFGQ